MTKEIKIKVTQKSIDEMNEIADKLGLPHSKLKAGQKLKALFG